MKLLLDTCVWGGAAGELKRAGHDVVWAGDWSQDPGDEALLGIAHRESRVLVTLDKDFGELAIVRGQQHSGSCASSASGPASRRLPVSGRSRSMVTSLRTALWSR